MTFEPTKIPGVVMVEPKVFADPRGFFYEHYNKRVFAANGIDTNFVQDNVSKSVYGTIRGLHAQRGDAAQAKLVWVIDGEVQDVVVDARHGSPTFGQHISVTLSSEKKNMLFIPRGLLHGFAALSATVTIGYKCDTFWCKEAEYGVRYDDPALGIAWQVPADKRVLSAKDAALGPWKGAD